MRRQILVLATTYCIHSHNVSSLRKRGHSRKEIPVVGISPASSRRASIKVYTISAAQYRSKTQAQCGRKGPSPNSHILMSYDSPVTDIMLFHKVQHNLQQISAGILDLAVHAHNPMSWQQFPCHPLLRNSYLGMRNLNCIWG